jgi:hypothetical protein
MKKIIILGLASAGILMGSFTASAAGDSQYPASDFQPKVVYIDKDAAAASASGDSTKCPGQKSEAKQTEFDPKYPAASFQPKAVYP